MRLATVTVCAMAVWTILGSTPGRTALTRDRFPPQTTGDLVALCSADKEDPLMTAAVNFCQGFTEGAVEMALGYEATTRAEQEPFCLPTPRPSHNDAMAQFVAWANADPKRLEDPPVIGLLRFWIQQYPCPRPAAKPPVKK